MVSKQEVGKIWRWRCPKCQRRMSAMTKMTAFALVQRHQERCSGGR
jgi:hypothetical protein